jgi:hypothetical protein
MDFQPESANLVVAADTEMGTHVILNFFGTFADGSELRVDGFPDDVGSKVSVRAFNRESEPDGSTIGRLVAPTSGLISFEIALDPNAFEALLKCFQARILPVSIQLSVPDLLMPASGGFYWRDSEQPMRISGVQITM